VPALSTAVVVLNWNGGDMVARCVASVLAQLPAPDEVLLVDNASCDGSAEALAERFPAVRQLRLPTNTGFAGGMNAGIAATTSDAVLVLNLDVELQPDYLARCAEALAADERLGGVTGKLLRFGSDGPPLLDSTGHRLYRNRRAVDRGELEPDTGQYDRAPEVFGVGGAAPLLRRTMLDDVRHAPQEYFDADFFAYFEDIDLCWRARLRGWAFGYVPAAVAHHHRGGTGGRRSDAIEAGNHRNRLLLMVKDDAVASLVRHLPGLVITELRVTAHLLSTRPRVVLLTWLGVLRLLPRMLRKRRSVQGSRTVGWRELEPWLEPYDYLAVLRRRRP
jgi:GT2 family glycosyltransferase